MLELGLYASIIIVLLFTLLDLVRWNLKNAVVGISILLVLLLVVVIGHRVLGFHHMHRTFGENVDLGKPFYSFACCYDHHGDGIDFVVFEGDLATYNGIAKRLKASETRLPSAKLNINGFPVSEPWLACSKLEQYQPEAFRFLYRGLEYASSPEINARALTEESAKSEGSLCALNYDGNDIDFWLLRVDKPYFINASVYE